MATDYFAHAVYGIVPGKEIQERLEANVLMKMEKLWEHDEDLYEDEVRSEAIAWVAQTESFQNVLRELGAPAAAQLLWSGHPDERPGRCQCDSEMLIIGFGLPAFPEAALTSKEAPWPVTWHPDWYTWVTSG